MVQEGGDLLLVGRDRELARILPALEMGEQEKPGIILLMGEAGVGKTRLAREVVAKAVTRGWCSMTGKCLHESMTPYMPIMEALREGKLEHLMEFSRLPRVEHVLFVRPDGRICAKVSRSEGLLDTEIFAGMLTAVGAFVQDSLSGMLDAFRGGEGFNVMGYERFRIVAVGRPEGNLVLIMTGQETELLKDEMAEMLDSIVRKYGSLFCDWDGSSKTMEPLTKELESFINSGRFDGVDEVTEPENRHWRLLTNVTRGIFRASIEAPILLFLDDLQWADPSSLGLVRYLLKRLTNERFLVLGTSRTEELSAEHPLVSIRRELEAEGKLVAIDMAALPREDVMNMVEQEVGKTLGRGELGGLIASESGGNPFLARELVALLREESILVKEGGEWQLIKKVERIGIPRKVGETISARLGGLSRDEREVLETGAILGEIFKPGPVACVLNVNTLQVHRALREIEKRYRLVRSVEEGRRFQFNHPIVREVVYEGVPSSMRNEYHRTVVDCLLKEGGTGLSHLTEVAYHAFEGKHPEGVAHLKAAGDAARSEFHNAEAIRFYTSALELAKKEDNYTLFEALGETEYGAGNLEMAVTWLDKARNATSDRDRRVLLVARLGRALERQGKPYESLGILQSDEPDERTSAMVAARWKATRAWTRVGLRDIENAITDAKEALAAFDTCDGSAEDVSDCWNTMGALKFHEGKYDEVHSYLLKGLAVAEAGGVHHQTARILHNMGMNEIGKGNYSMALDFLDKSLQYSKRIGNRFQSATSLMVEGRVKLYLGRIEDSYEALSQSIQALEDIGAKIILSGALVFRSHCLLELGRLEEAAHDASEALSLSRDSPENTIRTTLFLAQLYLEENNPDEAVRSLQRIVSLLHESGNDKYTGTFLLSLGNALAAQGNRDEAYRSFQEAIDSHINTIEAWYLAVGLRWWGEALASWGEKEEAIKKLEAARSRFIEMGASLELRKVESELSKIRII